jgi:cell division protein FtsL
MLLYQQHKIFKIALIFIRNKILEDKNLSFELLVTPTVSELKKQVEDLSHYEVISESFIENGIERNDNDIIARQGFIKYTINVK